MARIKIECDNCGFIGTLSFSNDEFSDRDIQNCPVCASYIGADDYDDDDYDECDESGGEW